MSTKVLIAQESEAMSKMLADVLKTNYQGVEVVIAPEVTNWSELLGEINPKLILYGKEHDQTRLDFSSDANRVPIVLLVEKKDAEIGPDFWGDNNVIGVLQKPFEYQGLNNKIREFLQVAPLELKSDLPHFEAIDKEIISLFEKKETLSFKDPLFDELEETVDPVKQYQKTAPQEELPATGITETNTDEANIDLNFDEKQASPIDLVTTPADKDELASSPPAEEPIATNLEQQTAALDDSESHTIDTSDDQLEESITLSANGEATKTNEVNDSSDTPPQEADKIYTPASELEEADKTYGERPLDLFDHITSNIKPADEAEYFPEDTPVDVNFDSSFLSADNDQPASDTKEESAEAESLMATASLQETSKPAADESENIDTSDTTDEVLPLHNQQSLLDSLADDDSEESTSENQTTHGDKDHAATDDEGTVSIIEEKFNTIEDQIFATSEASTEEAVATAHVKDIDDADKPSETQSENQKADSLSSPDEPISHDINGEEKSAKDTDDAATDQDTKEIDNIERERTHFLAPIDQADDSEHSKNASKPKSLLGEEFELQVDSLKKQLHDTFEYEEIPLKDIPANIDHDEKDTLETLSEHEKEFNQLKANPPEDYEYSDLSLPSMGLSKDELLAGVIADEDNSAKPLEQATTSITPPEDQVAEDAKVSTETETKNILTKADIMQKIKSGISSEKGEDNLSIKERLAEIEQHLQISEEHNRLSKELLTTIKQQQTET